MIGDILVLTAFGYGIASALIPVVNAEAYVAGSAVVLSGTDVIWMVAAVTLGTVVGKVILFRAARAGRELRQRAQRPRPAAGRVCQWVHRCAEVMIGWLDRPVRAIGTVIVSSFAGIPPLLAVAVVAGVSSMRTDAFALSVLVGRAGRFSLIAGAAYGLF